MNKIRVLQYGERDWRRQYTLPEHIELDYFEEQKTAIKGGYDLLVVDSDVRSEVDLKLLLSCVKAYCVFLTENVTLSGYTEKLNAYKCGKRLYTGDVELFLKEAAPSFFTTPYGEKFARSFLVENSGFRGEVEYSGSYDLLLTGEFGETFRQAAYWKNNIPLFEGQCLDLYLEYAVTGTVEVKLVVYQFYPGATKDFQQIWEFSGEQLRDVVRIENGSAYGPLFVSVLAKGTGTLKIISLHDRHSRKDFGYFLPGGERFATSKGEEIFCYYDPGDLKPPLSFYFSGYRGQEGFEGYYMMRKMGCPFVLVTDPRLEGGAFYLGDEEYEQLMLRVMRGYMDKIGFDRDQVIISGVSMGTFGSLYYGCDICPHAFILGKPLTSMGNVAKNETLERVGGFPTSLDILLTNYGDLSENSIRKLNDRFWDKFDRTDWGDTKFIISYLYEDDYDPDGYTDILMHLNSAGVSVYGKGIHGHHTDNTDQIIQWFKSQYHQVFREDFQRET